MSFLSFMGGGGQKVPPRYSLTQKTPDTHRNALDLYAANHVNLSENIIVVQLITVRSHS